MKNDSSPVSHMFALGLCACEREREREERGEALIL